MFSKRITNKCYQLLTHLSSPLFSFLILRYELSFTEDEIFKVQILGRNLASNPSNLENENVTVSRVTLVEEFEMCLLI